MKFDSDEGWVVMRVCLVRKFEEGSGKSSHLDIYLSYVYQI